MTIIGQSTGAWPLIRHAEALTTSAVNLITWIRDVEQKEIPGPLQQVDLVYQMAGNILALAGNALTHAGRLATEPGEVEAILVRQKRVGDHATPLMRREARKPVRNPKKSKN